MKESEKLYQGILQKYNVKTFKDLTVKQRTEILQALSEMERKYKNDGKI